MMQKHLKAFASVGVAMFALTLPGCVTSPDVVFVDTTQDIIRLGRDVRGHVYYQKSGRWIRSANKVTLPPGWYAGGLPPDPE